MIPLVKKIKHYFNQQPLPAVTFQFTSRYVSGIRVHQKERDIKQSFIYSLDNGVISPSFSQKNIQNRGELERQLKSGLKKLGTDESKAGFLLPEMSQKTFVFSFETLPSASQERDLLVRFRIKKQIPMVPDDVRILMKSFFTGKEYRVLVTAARASIIKEYEDLLSQLGVKIRIVGIPSLALTDLFDFEKNKDILVVNIESDSLSMISILDSKIAIYRQKQILMESTNGKNSFSNIQNIVQEIEKTVQFLEDKEKRRIKSIWIRSGNPNESGELFSELTENLDIELKDIASIIPFKLSTSEKKMLSPLIGHAYEHV